MGETLSGFCLLAKEKNLPVSKVCQPLVPKTDFKHRFDSLNRMPEYMVSEILLQNHNISTFKEKDNKGKLRTIRSLNSEKAFQVHNIQNSRKKGVTSHNKLGSKQTNSSFSGVTRQRTQADSGRWICQNQSMFTLLILKSVSTVLSCA